MLFTAVLFFTAGSHSKSVSPDEGKAALLTAILDHTRWPDEAEVDTFVIGLYSRDRSLYRILSKEFSGKQIRGKPVQVRNIDSLPQAVDAQVLVLNPEKNSDLRRIVDFLDKRPILIVSDSSDDERHVMINFTHPAENILSFELNRSNIVYAGLDLSKEILLFGGTELDTALIYKETEAELARAKELAEKQREELSVQQSRLVAQEEKIKERDKELADKESMLLNLEKSLGLTRKELSESEASLLANEEALRRKESVLSQKEQAIDSYSREISENLSMLESQRAALDIQQKEIDQKESLIAEKNAILKEQVTTIENQKLFLVWGALALLVVSTLIGIIARSYRIKNKLNKALESKTSELEQVNRQLVTMTEAKSQFLSTMSHEIRTPLNGVIGVAELLESTELTKHQSEYVSIILKSGDTLLSLINDILDISKIEAGKLELENVPFNLGEILGDTLQTLSLKANEKELELAFHIPPEVPNNIVGDPGRFRQIIVNLVGNAIKFTERGEIVVDLKLESSDSTKVRLGFEVRDTGIGISENQLQKIFEAFGQADSSTTRQYGGTGLGLTIASQLVAMMGGELKVSSEAGVGSTFSFSAEFKVSDELDNQPHSPADLKNKKVLVVDDNSTNRMILEEILRSWNMHVEVAQSGPDAIELLEQSKNDDEPYSLAVLDVMMPGMDGFELAEKIRQDAFFKTMRVLVLSSTEFAGNEKRQKQLDISRTLLKPVKHSDLLVAITNALGVASAEDHTPALSKTPSDLQPRNVLLVEDGFINQKVATDLLTKRGHSVTLAENGEEAVIAVKESRFDVVLMDVQMPVKDGLTATREIRELERTSGDHIPIVAMTASATTEDRQKCLEAGMDDFVSKPFRASELFSAVEAVPVNTDSQQKITAKKPKRAE